MYFTWFFLYKYRWCVPLDNGQVMDPMWRIIMINWRKLKESFVVAVQFLCISPLNTVISLRNDEFFSREVHFQRCKKNDCGWVCPCESFFLSRVILWVYRAASLISMKQFCSTKMWHFRSGILGRKVTVPQKISIIEIIRIHTTWSRCRLNLSAISSLVG